MSHLFCYFCTQAFNPAAIKDSPILGIIEELKKGFSGHWMKAFLIFETRYFQASTLGLPIEISKYYQSVNAFTANGKVF